MLLKTYAPMRNRSLIGIMPHNIGSGTIESGVKQFKQRLAGTGMRWNVDNANRMLVLRAAVLGNDFDALWEAAA